MTYIERIKQIKSERKITNEMLSEMTDIPLGTLTKIMAGVSESPKLSNIVSICQALGCTLDYVVSGIPVNECNFLLSDSEIKLIETYRTLDSFSQRVVALVAEQEALRQNEEQSKTVVLPTASKIKKSDTKKGEKHGVLLTPMDKTFKPVTDKKSLPEKRKIALYDLPVSAGVGEYLFESSSTFIQIPVNEKTETADFALRVSGDSMEPKYHNGDLLLVEEANSVEEGELGIFMLDGDGFFKKFGGDRLISLNENYGPILLKDHERVECCGRVVGKIRRA